MTNPKYRTIANSLRDRIRRREWLVGDRITSMIDLQHEYGAAQHTVRHALEELVTESVLKIERGRGAFVQRVPRPPSSAGSVMQDLEEALAALRRAIDGLRGAA